MTTNKFEIEFEKKVNEFEIELGDKIKVVFPELEDLEVIPSNEEQIIEGKFKKVLVNGDEDLIPENIVSGVNIFGVEGTAKGETPKGYLDTSVLASGQYLFQNCEATSLPFIYTDKMTTMQYMFLSNYYLEEIEGFSDTSNSTNMYGTFMRCQSLKAIPKAFNTENSIKLTACFYQCFQLTSLHELDCSKIYEINNVFGDGNDHIYVENTEFQMTDLGGFKDLGKAYTYQRENNGSYTLDLSKLLKLTRESLMNVINKLYDLNLSYKVASGGTLYRQSLVLGETNLAKLTEDEIAIATNKGWNVT